jgi:hypothetical protein
MAWLNSAPRNPRHWLNSECIKKRALRPHAVERKDGIRDTIFGTSLPIGRRAPVCVSAIADGCPSLSIGRGRDTSHLIPPAQIRTSTSMHTALILDA